MSTFKRTLLEALVALLEEEIAARVKSAEVTRAGATHAEARPENDKDTRALEASYLARGQAQRVEELQDATARVRFLQPREFQAEEAIDACAVVDLSIDGETSTVFLVPDGGGRTIQQDGEAIKAISPASPLGRALMSKRQGDDFELRLGQRLREYEITGVR